MAGYTRDGTYLRLKRVGAELLDELEDDGGVPYIWIWRARYRLEFPARTASHSADRIVGHTHSQGILTAVNGYASIAYQPSGLVSTVTHTGGLTETWQPDPNGMSRPRRIVVTDPSGFQWTHGDYAYDGAGNIKQIGSRLYRYDRVGRRLVWDTDTAAGVPVTTAYSYDAFGNRTLEGTWAVAGDFVARLGNRTIPVSSATNRLAGRAQYDPAGNLTRWAANLSSTSSAGDYHFLYDAAGMMLTQTTTGREIHHLYTADDERIASIDRLPTGNRTTWTLRGTATQLLRTYLDDTTTAIRTWTWKEDQIWRGSALLAAETPTGTTPYALDHLGSPRVVARPTHPPALQFFDAFGKGGTTDGGSLQFTAHERDRAFVAGEWQEPLDYMHARHYGPGVGRFFSVDPTWVSADLGQPQSWNRYTYVLNNPVRNVDPDGRVTFGSKDAESAYRVAAAYLKGSPTARKWLDLFERLNGANEPNLMTIGGKVTHYNRRTNTIAWNPQAANVIKALNGGSRDSGGPLVQSPAIGLLHEIIHAIITRHPEVLEELRRQTPDNQLEEWLVINYAESPAAAELDEPLRRVHWDGRAFIMGETLEEYLHRMRAEAELAKHKKDRR